jgi:hypothetical protein
MADVATPSGAAMFDAGNTEKKDKSSKPTAPDAEAYKAALAKLEKEHKAAMDRYVSCMLWVPIYELWLSSMILLSEYLLIHPKDRSQSEM